MKYFFVIILCFFIVGCSTSASENISFNEPVKESFDEPDGVLDCPFHIINDAYPGRCGLYNDENNDHLCDLGQ